MDNHIKQYADKLKDLIYRFRDVRFTGQVIFGLLVLLLSWSGVKAIQTNYDLQKQINTLKQQNQVQQLEDNNLKLQNEYYNSNQYLGLSARQNYGLGLPGEKELIIPQAIALSHTVPVPNKASKVVASESQPTYQRNFQAWIDFFLDRSPN
jgi:cell division protein FtsB